MVMDGVSSGISASTCGPDVMCSVGWLPAAAGTISVPVILA